MFSEAIAPWHNRLVCTLAVRDVTHDPPTAARTHRDRPSDLPRQAVHSRPSDLGVAHPRPIGRWHDADAILEQYAGLEADDIRACMAYAAEMTRERIVVTAAALREDQT